MGDRDVVSVVVPSKDRLELLQQTVASILGQEGVDVEVLVVDDGSSDGTSAWLAATDPRVRGLRHDQSRGVCRARNRGVAEAASDWVAFCDDDDLWHPRKLRTQLDLAQQRDVGWVVAGAAGFDDRRRRVEWIFRPSAPAHIAERLPVENVVPGGASGVLARRDLLGDSPFDPALRVLADWDAWVGLLERGGPPAAVPKALVAYRMHDGSMSRRHDGVLEEARRIVEDRIATPRDLRWLHRWMGAQAVRAGDRRSAVAAYLRSARTGDTDALARVVAVGLLGPRTARSLRRNQRPTADQERVLAWLNPLLEGPVDWARGPGSGRGRNEGRRGDLAHPGQA